MTTKVVVFAFVLLAVVDAGLKAVSPVAPPAYHHTGGPR